MMLLGMFALWSNVYLSFYSDYGEKTIMLKMSKSNNYAIVFKALELTYLVEDAYFIEVTPSFLANPKYWEYKEEGSYFIAKLKYDDLLFDQLNSVNLNWETLYFIFNLGDRNIEKIILSFLDKNKRVDLLVKMYQLARSNYNFKLFKETLFLILKNLAFKNNLELESLETPGPAFTFTPIVDIIPNNNFNGKSFVTKFEISYKLEVSTKVELITDGNVATKHINAFNKAIQKYELLLNTLLGTYGKSRQEHTFEKLKQRYEIELRNQLSLGHLTDKDIDAVISSFGPSIVEINRFLQEEQIKYATSKQQELIEFLVNNDAFFYYFSLLVEECAPYQWKDLEKLHQEVLRLKNLL